MSEAEVRVGNRLGLHARPAARFVHAASQFRARITVARDAMRADGKSILGLLSLAAPCGALLRMTADGEDEREALAHLVELVQQGLGEEA